MSHEVTTRRSPPRGQGEKQLVHIAEQDQERYSLLLMPSTNVRQRHRIRNINEIGSNFAELQQQEVCVCGGGDNAGTKQRERATVNGYRQRFENTREPLPRFARHFANSTVPVTTRDVTRRHTPHVPTASQAGKQRRSTEREKKNRSGLPSRPRTPSVCRSVIADGAMNTVSREWALAGRCSCSRASRAVAGRLGRLSTASGAQFEHARRSSPVSNRLEVQPEAATTLVGSNRPSECSLGAAALKRWKSGGSARPQRWDHARTPEIKQPAQAFPEWRRPHPTEYGWANERSERAQASTSIGVGARRAGGWGGPVPGSKLRSDGSAAAVAAGPPAVAAAAAEPAPGASSMQLEQVSIMRRLKQAKVRRDGEEAKRVLEDALAQDDAAELVDVYVFSAVVGVFAKTGHWEAALGVLRTMKERGVRSNAFTYNQAITACGNGGAWNWAVYLLKAMPAADVVSYNAAISACAKGGQPEVAEVLLREMTEIDGVAPNALTYGTVISALVPASGTSVAAAAAGNRWKRVVELLEEMRDRQMKPHAASYDLAVAACVAAGKADAAVKLLRQMREEEGMTPDLARYNTALVACRKAVKWELAVVLLGELKAAVGVSPDSTTYAEVIDTCRRGCQPDLVAGLSKEMKEAGLA